MTSLIDSLPGVIALAQEATAALRTIENNRAQITDLQASVSALALEANEISTKIDKYTYPSRRHREPS